MKKINYILLLIVGMIPFTYSCNYLDVDKYFHDLTPLDSIFARQSYLERYLWGAAGLLPNPGDLYASSYGPYMTAVDEAQLSWQKGEYAGTYLYAGEITPFSGHYNMWSRYYKGIRKCNTIMTRIDECEDLKAIDRREILGLTHFLRGAFYYYLVELYGPVVLVPDKPLGVDSDVDAISFERNSYDECIDYICEDMEIAYGLLEPKRPTTNFDRPTKFAAAALMSRIRLTQASPWYNGNTFYGSWKNEEGEHFISQQVDLKKWSKAAAVAKRIIESGQFSLHVVPAMENTIVVENASQLPFPNGVGDIDPFHSYADMFNGEALAVKNPEIIYPSNLSGNATQIAFPLHMGGWNGLGVTQKLVDAYYMADGSDYQQEADYYERIGSDKIFSEYTLKGSAAKMFDNREMRFYASIGFSECFWPATSLTAPNQNPEGRTNQTITYYVNGNTAKQASNPEDYNLTGYTMKKYIHPEDNFWQQGTVKPKTFPAFRYAEILLNYVEALNEMKGEPPYTEEVESDGMSYTVSYSPEEIATYFNQVRFRAGLPGISILEASNQEKVRELIKRERMIEFAHEGRRYHDLRRWGIANEEENKPVQGMDVTQKSEDREAFYTITNIMHKYTLREFTDKMYFYPIPRFVLDKNTKLVQNPGWDGWDGW